MIFRACTFKRVFARGGVGVGGAKSAGECLN